MPPCWLLPLHLLAPWWEMRVVRYGFGTLTLFLYQSPAQQYKG